MFTECTALMGPMGWVMPIALLLLLGLGIASLIKYLFTSPRSTHHSGDRS
ncbi:hypothetical protein [Halomonas sp. C05BenzN]